MTSEASKARDSATRALTPAQRARLVEVMRLAHSECRTTEAWSGNRYENVEDRRERARSMRIEAAIAAAERAGFSIAGPADG